MTDEIILYTNPMSRGRTARWMLEEVGVPYRAEILEFGTTLKSPEYLAIKPKHRRGWYGRSSATATRIAARLRSTMR